MMEILKRLLVGFVFVGGIVGALALLAWIHPMLIPAVMATVIAFGCSLAIGEVLLGWWRER